MLGWLILCGWILVTVVFPAFGGPKGDKGFEKRRSGAPDGDQRP